ncbi:MAG: hypothetical protein FWG18_02550 [Alphaproteobacteria bacterium]|nr:hypothetical protein [Alphaproteobacteria bacterium]
MEQDGGRQIYGWITIGGKLQEVYVETSNVRFVHGPAYKVYLDELGRPVPENGGDFYLEVSYAGKEIQRLASGRVPSCKNLGLSLKEIRYIDSNGIEIGYEIKTLAGDLTVDRHGPIENIILPEHSKSIMASMDKIVPNAAAPKKSPATRPALPKHLVLMLEEWYPYRR